MSATDRRSFLGGAAAAAASIALPGLARAGPGLRRDGLPRHIHGLRLPIAPPPQLIREPLANRGPGAIPWQRADVHKQICPAVPRRNEAEASIITP